MWLESYIALQFWSRHPGLQATEMEGQLGHTEFVHKLPASGNQPMLLSLLKQGTGLCDLPKYFPTIITEVFWSTRWKDVIKEAKGVRC